MFLREENFFPRDEGIPGISLFACPLEACTHNIDFVEDNFRKRKATHPEVGRCKKHNLYQLKPSCISQ